MSVRPHPLRCAALWVLLTAGPAAALQLELPVNAQLTAERASKLDSFDAPIAAFDGVGVPALTLEGRVERRAWRVSSPGLTALQVIAPLRAQLEQQGYDPIFECDARNCGGFDFRFNVEVLPGPNMYVNIADYRYLTVVRGDPSEPEAVVSVLTSVTRGAAYVQIITVATPLNAVIEIPELVVAPQAPERPTEADREPVSFADRLLRDGHATLSELQFATGTSELGPGPFASLAELATFMQQETGYRVLLVGHTDTVGALAGNINLSRARAASVRARLISEFGIEASRLDAEGMGYLAPIASNLSEEGRRQNRRVEAVLLPSR